MWDAPNKCFDRIALTQARKVLRDNVISSLPIPANGVVFVFDDADYQDHRDYTWRPQSFHRNIKAEGVQNGPEHLVRLMESKEYAHLIWLGRRVCLGEKIHFAWVFAHELQHLVQDTCSHTLSLAGYFLYWTLDAIEIDEPKVTTTVPTELDAELAAWRAVQDIFGKEAADKYVQNSSVSAKDAEAFRVLMSHDPEEPYDVCGHTIDLLRKYQPQLEAHQPQGVYEFIRTFNIDEVCQELSRGGNGPA